MVQSDVPLGEESCAVVGVRTKIQEVKLRCVLLWFVAAKHKFATTQGKGAKQRKGGLSEHLRRNS